MKTKREKCPNCNGSGTFQEGGMFSQYVKCDVCFGTGKKVECKTRNPARIYPLLNKIGEYWVQNPDLRLGQIIVNFTGLDGASLFHLEDEEFEKLIDKYAKKK